MTGVRIAADEVGTSPAAIALHYDLPVDFFRLWLGDKLTYSCALWAEGDELASAQNRKIDWFAERLAVNGAQVLDVGCGWGALLERFVHAHGAAGGTGLTLSAAQANWANQRAAAGITFRAESWLAHEPERTYEVITAIESTEHFASDRLDQDGKVAVYRRFFDRAASWLTDGGRLGLQLICLDGAGHQASRPNTGPVTDLINTAIFPDAMSSSLGEMVLGWETHFRLVEFVDHTGHYVRTFRAWAQALRRAGEAAERAVGADNVATFARYFAAGELMFRMRTQSLYRVVLVKRPQPKAWAVQLRPSMLTTTDSESRGASAAAIRSHYDVSNDFYAAWLGPTMMYSSGLWEQGDPPDLDAATSRKIDFFAGRVVRPGHRVLDVGCGWGGALRRLVERHGISAAVGLTLSAAQHEYLMAHPVQGADIRLEDWADHAPDQPYDAIVSFGAFEHFARDGMTGPQRVACYRRFFAACYSWLRPGGRLGLETIAHDDAPDTASLLGRGPLGDVVLELYPESLCPHLSEVILGFEPWFEVELLRCDAADFARTFRGWQRALRENDEQATRAADAETVTSFRRYLAASEVQFRDGTITNLRFVLHRRAEPRR